MKNNGLFCSLFLEELRAAAALDDAARGRLTALAQTWQNRNLQDAESLWNSFVKQALSYLEFVPPAQADAPGLYPLYEDWSFSRCVGVLCLTPPEIELDADPAVWLYPARLLARLEHYQTSWGIVTNGSRWRIYCANSARPYEDYLELPLEQILEDGDENEYGLFERFFHKAAFVPDNDDSLASSPSLPKRGGRGVSSPLDRLREQSEQVLEHRVKTPLLSQVDEVLQHICNGFIADTRKSGSEYSEQERSEIFESAVKLIYRCLFLFYAEARRLLPSDPQKAELYRRHSIRALCDEARKFRWGDRRDNEGYELWQHVQGLTNAVNEGDPEYGIMGYNGGLFDDEEERFLGQHRLRNDFLARALYLLAFVEPFDNDGGEEYAIPYADLEVRHLGELYENILEYTVQLADADRFRRRSKKGVSILLTSQTTKQSGDSLIRKGEVYFGESALDRKQSGSYYTPEPLVRFLNRKSIVEPLRQRFEQQYRQRFDKFLEQARNAYDEGAQRGAAQSATALLERFVENEVLTFTVCDPSMGSGHFLVNAANRMTGLVAELHAQLPDLAINSQAQSARTLKRPTSGLQPASAFSPGIDAR
ncbi:MAG: hypothetical protein GY801_25495, partial [bacterium]|nr:hypothetical protein [bacterium]